MLPHEAKIGLLLVTRFTEEEVIQCHTGNVDLLTRPPGA